RRSERKWPSSDAPDCGSHNSVFNCVDLRVRPLARGVGDPGAKTGWAAGRRLSASRDWPKSDKSIYSSCRHRLAWRARSFSPFLWNQRKLPYACSSMVIKREFLPTANPEEPLFFSALSRHIATLRSQERFSALLPPQCPRTVLRYSSAVPLILPM